MPKTASTSLLRSVSRAGTSGHRVSAAPQVCCPGGACIAPVCEGSAGAWALGALGNHGSLFRGPCSVLSEAPGGSCAAGVWTPGSESWFPGSLLKCRLWHRGPGAVPVPAASKLWGPEAIVLGLHLAQQGANTARPCLSLPGALFGALQPRRPFWGMLAFPAQTPVHPMGMMASVSAGEGVLRPLLAVVPFSPWPTGMALPAQGVRCDRFG